MTEIAFYRADEKPYGVFSNLFKRPMRFMGGDFSTAEHAYQYGKARKPEVRDWLMAAPSPSLLAMAAHGLYSWDVVPGWSELKIPRMRAVLWSKFGQHADLRATLMSTVGVDLVESAAVGSDTNRFWGRVNGKGKNWLGVLLMGVREDFRTGILTDKAIHGLAEGIDPDGKRSAWAVQP